MKLLSRFRAIVLVAVTICALTVGVALANTRHHGPGGPGSGGDRGRPGHGACVHGKRQLERNKANVVAFYTTAFNDKQPELAVARYVGATYIQHNPFAGDGPQAFIDFVKAYAAQNPQLNVDIKRVIAECDLVVTHSHITTSPTDLGSAAADIFRLDRNGKIVEHWDVVQPVPATSANDNGMF